MRFILNSNVIMTIMLDIETHYLLCESSTNQTKWKTHKGEN